MNKVLLVYEDYSEMMTIQSVLKKVGFDVVTATSEFSLAQQVLSFNPDIIVGYGKGPKVSTVGVGRRLKEMPRWGGKVVLIFPAGLRSDPAELAKVRMDMALEAPLEVTRLLQVLANLTNQDARVLVETMMKAVAQEAETQMRVSNNAAQAKDDQTVFVAGSREKVESWNVKNTKEVDEFNKLMGIADPPPKARNEKPTTAATAKSMPLPGPAAKDPAGSSSVDSDSRSTDGAGKTTSTDPAQGASSSPASEKAASDSAMVSGDVGIADRDSTAVTGTSVAPDVSSSVTGTSNESAPPTPASTAAAPTFPLAPDRVATEPVPLNLAPETPPERDFKADETPNNMVSGGGASTEPSQMVTGNVGASADEPIAVRMQKELAQAEAKIAGKMQGYDRFLKDLPAPKVKSIKRTEARKAQKNLMQGWTEEELKSQDELRREFTNGLFKKKD